MWDVYHMLYVSLTGYGYDSDDPFIDNSDVHDEMVPAQADTALGGFYVNCGALEFKVRESADEDSDVEAVVAEGDKAARKRKYCKKDEGEKAKKSKMEEDATSSSTEAKKARKEGAKPLGR